MQFLPSHLEVDWIALSFVRHAEDLKELQALDRSE